jgi:hypothetical protein
MRNQVKYFGVFSFYYIKHAVQLLLCHQGFNLNMYHHCKGNPVMLRKSLSLAGGNPKMNISGYNTWKHEILT